ncbi:mastermind-like protein 1 [Sinocyclocheilus rhinocerous]|uniref:mastermind-like protein 1 n=1 Tax=Sinocyclocheilus rhinocerous TaxID=307959 RepID=UPI0007BA6EFC|nr:PREDICTED: mastermind-like protein 1 [Sinocyclocheilus rhinocerous]
MMADFVVPRHSAVMERLRRRIELFRRHHTGCENRYDSTAMERLEMDRQQTFALHQRCLQTKAKRPNKHRQPAAASADPAGQRGTGGGGGTGAELADGASGTAGEQSRNSTLIALQETVKRKLENAGSPLGRDQVNGFTDGYPPNKKACVEDALGGLNGVSNGTVPPLSPMDSKYNVSTEAMMANGNNRAVGAEHNGSGLTDSGALRGSESDFRLKEMKQEPVDDILPCILPGGGANGNNSLFPDLNLNDQDWSEIMEEFNRSVPYEDIQELFSDSFGDRKDPELPCAGAAQSLLPPDLVSVKTEFSPATAHSAFDQDSCNGSPQVRPTSSGPPLHTNSPISPALPVQQQPTRPLPNHLLPVPPKDLSPAQQLQQLAAREQQRAILQQHVVQKPPQEQKPQQQQAAKFHQQPNHSTSWPQNAPTQSQMGGTFGLEKSTSPSLYPQDFPNPKTLLMPNKGSPKAGAPAGYMQPGGHGNMLSHPAAPTGPLSHPPNPGAQAAMLDYSNTKPLSHYEAGAPGAPRGPQATQNQNKPNQAILNLMRHQQMAKQRPTSMNFRPAHHQHAPDSGSYPSSTHVPGPGNTMTPQQSSNSIPGSHSNAAYMKQQQQMQLISQQKQFLQRQMMAEQEKQQLQRHLTRPPPQYQDQQNPQAQQNPFQQQQQVSQFTGVPLCLAQQHSSGLSEHTISGASQPIGNVSSLSGPTPGTQRMFSQAQGMMGMGVGQNTGPSTGPAPAASQADMNLPSCGLDVQQVLYGNMPMHPSHPNQQRPSVSSMSAAYRQNVLAAQQQAHLKNQPNAAMLKQQHQQQLARMPNSMPNALANNMGSAMPSSMPTNIQGALPSQAQSWQQQPQQHPGLQPGSANGGMPAGFPNSGFQMQSRLSKLPNNTPFPQGGMGNSAAGRTLAGMNPGQMMPNMNQQRTNNPGMAQQQGQGQPQAQSQTQQVLPDLGPFSQPQAGPSRTAGLQCSQAYQLNRTANQQLQFSYSAQSGSSLSGFSAETDLVDSLLKNPTTQEWMDDLDELLASHQ